MGWLLEGEWESTTNNLKETCYILSFDQNNNNFIYQPEYKLGWWITVIFFIHSWLAFIHYDCCWFRDYFTIFFCFSSLWWYFCLFSTLFFFLGCLLYIKWHRLRVRVLLLYVVQSILYKLWRSTSGDELGITFQSL